MSQSGEENSKELKRKPKRGRTRNDKLVVPEDISISIGSMNDSGPKTKNNNKIPDLPNSPIRF